MEKIVGQNSMMSQLYRNYEGNVKHEIPAFTGKDDDESIIISQWTTGNITKLEGIPIFDTTNKSMFQNSVQHLYDNKEDQSIPSRFSLVAGYEPELYYYMRYKLGYTEEESFIYITNAESLFAQDASSLKTLVNPSNLQFFFEKYKQGDLESIADRFTSNKTYLLTNKQITAIYEYLLFISDREFTSGEFGDSPMYAEHQAFGSILSKTLQVSYNHINSVFTEWFTARFFAAYNDVGEITCTNYMGAAGVTDPSKIVSICDSRDFNDPVIVKNFTDMIAASPQDQEKFGNDTGLLPNETKNLYDATVDGSLTANVKLMQQDLASSFGCKGDGQNPCSMDELTMMQWVSGNITVGDNWPASVKTTNTSILSSASSVSKGFRAKTSKFDQYFNTPELYLYMGPDPASLISLDAGWRLMNRTNGTSLDNKWNAAIVTDYVMRNPSTDDSKLLFASIYNIPDFYTFFNNMRVMGQNYLLGGAFMDRLQSEVTYGYDEPRFKYIFQNTTDPTFDFFTGNDIDMIDSQITPILALNSARVNNQTVSIYTGSESMDKVARVRYVNYKDYVNMQQSVFDGREISELPITPTAWLEQFQECTNGFQWNVKDTESKDDGTTFCSYDLTYLTLFTYKEDTDFGKKTLYGDG